MHFKSAASKGGIFVLFLLGMALLYLSVQFAVCSTKNYCASTGFLGVQISRAISVTSSVSGTNWAGPNDGDSNSDELTISVAQADPPPPPTRPQHSH